MSINKDAMVLISICIQILTLLKIRSCGQLTHSIMEKLSFGLCTFVAKGMSGWVLVFSSLLDPWMNRRYMIMISRFGFVVHEFVV